MKFDIVENGKLVPYRRLGECKRCGACCRKTISFTWDICKPGEYEEDTTPEDWHNWENFSVIHARGIHWYILVTKVEDQDKPCTALEGNLCSIHEDQFRIPPLCPLWPVHPKDLLEGCGYYFEKCEGGDASKID